MSVIQSVKGMHDVLPVEGNTLDFIEQCACRVMESFGYQRIRLPILEKTELFKRLIGEVTDIVEKEMYSFEDVGGERLSLRPEGTASCVRACLQHGLVGKGQQQRVWYSGPFFRRERPQKGRYRQFHQVGVEAIGFEGPDVDAELLLMNALLWERLGLQDVFVLKLNTLGDAPTRARYREVLIDYLLAHQSELDENARKRIHSNPLRVLDSKDEGTRAVVANAPRIADYLTTECKVHFDRLKAILTEASIAFEEDEHLVRGLDYYTRTVFEWVSAEDGMTVCAGGRYDGLIEQLGGNPVPAAGFACGIERVCAAYRGSLELRQADVYLIITDEQYQGLGQSLALSLRREVEQLDIVVACGGGSVKSQMKRADKSGARFALILGEEELKDRQITVRFLREAHQDQQRIAIDDIQTWIRDEYAKISTF